MFCLIPILFLLSSLQPSQSIQLVSVGNATIPAIIVSDNVDVIKYDKLSKNSTAEVFLPFILEDVGQSTADSIELKVNNVTTPIDKSKSRNSKIYLLTDEAVNNTISYKIMFGKLDNAKTGEYVFCITSSGQTKCATSFIFSLPIVAKFTKPKLGLEGDPIRISCVYESYPEVTEITWSLIRGSNLTTANITEIISNDHIKVVPGKESKRVNETLVIEKLIKSDSGIYMCSVSSIKGKDIALVKINVKDRWAALYPFIGIVIEVIILVVAILVYEKYQIRSQKLKNQTYLDEDNNKEPGIPLTTAGNDDDTVADGIVSVPAVEIESGDKTGDNCNADIVRQREAATAKNV